MGVKESGLAFTQFVGQITEKFVTVLGRKTGASDVTILLQAKHTKLVSCKIDRFISDFSHEGIQQNKSDCMIARPDPHARFLQS